MNLLKHTNIIKTISSKFIKRNKEMKEKFYLEGVSYFSQRDNEISPSISCYPTSIGMAMTYCLGLSGFDKSAIGAAPNEQIEDFVNKYMDSKDVTEWMNKNTTRLGKWIWKRARRTNYYVENYVFNKLMNPFGYQSKLSFNLSYTKFVSTLMKNQLPIILGGNFSKLSTVKGHIVCAIGYDSIKKEVIVNDPWGNALTGYKDRKNGMMRSYPESIFHRNGKKMYAQIITKT